MTLVVKKKLHIYWLWVITKLIMVEIVRRIFVMMRLTRLFYVK